jgi:hypothetical protein
MVTADKPVEPLGSPGPLELRAYGLAFRNQAGPISRSVAGKAACRSAPGVVTHGLFPPALFGALQVARRKDIESLEPALREAR